MAVDYLSPDRMRKLTVVAQDPGIKDKNGNVLLTQIEVEKESLAAGPKGYRIEVIDYDVSTDTLYTAAQLDGEKDYFAKPEVQKNFTRNFLNNPHFHSQNVYAIARSTLQRFEQALGRSVSWHFDFGSHLLKIAPHAFAEANAYYSREDQGLMFGYFPYKGQTVFTCLAHDIIVHETTHAILDGLRPFYITPSSNEQIAFHEGFADIVSLLSVLATPEIVNFALGPGIPGKPGLIKASQVHQNALKKTFLLGLADQMGEALSGTRGKALRTSSLLPPREDYLGNPDFVEPHRLGEVLVAIVINSYLKVWEKRIIPTQGPHSSLLNKERAIEEGVKAASQLLNIAIRAIDYLPPVDILFKDYLSAMLTADAELCPDDSKYHYRGVLLESFASYGIKPPSTATRQPAKRGQWGIPRNREKLKNEIVHLDSLKADPNAAYRWVWENRQALELDERAFTRVLSLMPITRVGPDRYILRETVVEVLQTLLLKARELPEFGIEPPKGMSPYQHVKLYGGNTLVFDEFGRLKFNIGNSVSSSRQQVKISHLWDNGYFDREQVDRQAFAKLHLHRVFYDKAIRKEQW